MAFARVVGTEIMDGAGAPIYLQGVGIGNWLLPEGYMFDMLKSAKYDSPRGMKTLTYELIGPEEADEFWGIWRERYFNRDDVEALARDGYNSIRIAFDWKVLFDERTLAVLEDGFALLDQAVAWCREFGLWVILDLHGAPGGQNGTNIDDGWGHPWLFLSEREQERTCTIWRVIAARYRKEEIVLGYDLLNEPLPEIYREYYPLLDPLYKKVAKAIREVDREHILILEGVNWASDITALGEPFDDNVVYQFHKYWSDCTKEKIQPFLDFQNRWQVPLWCGETGENQYAWYRDCSRLLKEHNIGWNFWPHKKRGENSSPYNLVMPEEWAAVLNYARTGERPSRKTAQAAFSKLLDAIQIGRCERDEEAIQSWLNP